MPTAEELGLVPTQQPPGSDLPGADRAGLTGDGLGETFYAYAGDSPPDDQPVQAGGAAVTGPADPLAWLMPSGAQVGPATTGPAAGAAGTVNWEDAGNPYKQRYEQARESQPTPAQALDAEINGYRRDAVQAEALLVQNGMEATAARAVTAATLQAVIAQAQNRQYQAVTAPAAQQLVATRIAEQYTIPGQVTIDPRMLMEEKSPAAMDARARTIAGFMRNGQFTQRAAARVDRVETSGSTAGAGIGGVDLSPFEEIRAGLRQARNHR